ncbi:MAG: 50S ribosomal protein L17 [Candidatus Paceibacterota bacterium]|jgi:large subunit ribosomal protein L17
MRHHNTNRKFGRKKNGRNALLKSLVLNLIIKEKIKTTLAKAKEVRPVIEKLITRAKKGDLSTRRVILAKLYNRKTETKKLFDKIAPRYKSRNGGYTRIVKLGKRVSDGAEMAQIEFVD